MKNIKDCAAMTKELFSLSDEQLLSDLRVVREAIKDDPKVFRAIHDLSLLIAELEGKTVTKH